MGKTSRLHLALIIFGSGIALAKILVSFLLIWLTLGWKVRRARKTFEKQLIEQGMAKYDAERIGAKYAALKDNIENVFKQSLRWR